MNLLFVLPCLGKPDIQSPVRSQHTNRVSERATKICEEPYKEIDEMPSVDEPLENCDLVGFSSLTARIYDTYELAARYRAAGIPVVLGGLHVTMNPNEASEHADSIVIQEQYWDRCTLFDLNFKPTHITGEQLKEGMLWLFSEVYNSEQYLLRKRHYIDILKARMDEAEFESKEAN